MSGANSSMKRVSLSREIAIQCRYMYTRNTNHTLEITIHKAARSIYTQVKLFTIHVILK